MNSNIIIRRYDSQDRLVQAAAGMILESSLAAVAARGRFDFVLSGGSTPAPLYRMLARSPFTSAIPWKQTHFYWGDERIVPPDDEESNYGQVRRLLLESINFQNEHVHRIKGELEPIAAANTYSGSLLALASARGGQPLFDLALLGLGGDGHTASLFPGSISESEEKSLAAAVLAEYDGRPAHRVTMTHLALNQSRLIIFMVTGEGKADAVKKALEGSHDPVTIPTHRISAESGTIYWMLDEGAASRLEGNYTMS